MKNTKPLFCRVPVETFNLIHSLAGGPKSIGSFVNRAVNDFVNRDQHLVKVVMEALKAQGNKHE